MRGAGNIKMRGRKTKLLYCGCCVCVDKRDAILERVELAEASMEVAGIDNSSEEDMWGHFLYDGMYDMWFDWDTYYDL